MSDKREGYPGSGDGPTMPPPPPDPSGYQRGDVTTTPIWPVRRTLDPVRACALQAAAELVGLASELVSREDLQGLGGVVLTLAHRFETWLVGLSSEAP